MNRKEKNQLLIVNGMAFVEFSGQPSD